MRLFKYLVASALLFTGCHVNDEVVDVKLPDAVTYNYQDAVKKANAEGKPLIIYFGATWCGPCRQFKKTTLHDAKVVDELDNNYVFVMVDVDKDNDNLSKKYSISLLPTIIKEHRNKITRQSGYMNANEFIKWMKK